MIGREIHTQPAVGAGRMLRRRIGGVMSTMLAAAALLLAATAGGCSPDTDPAGPLVDTTINIPGTYRTTSFIVPNAANRPDSVHRRGGYIALTLVSGGRVTGRLYIPAAEQGQAVDLDITGTYTVSGDTVTFDTNDEWPVDAVRWLYFDNQLHSMPAADEPVMIVMHRR